MIIGCLGMIYIVDDLERFAYYRNVATKPDSLRMEEVENDRLMQSHTVLKEAVSRCCRDFRVANHVPWPGFVNSVFSRSVRCI